jgi:NADH:ubiquinone oxidoreductase subunit B-like Fe-S oxidoreductase
MWWQGPYGGGGSAGRGRTAMDLVAVGRTVAVAVNFFFIHSKMYAVCHLWRTAMFYIIQKCLSCGNIGARQRFAVRIDKKRTAKAIYRTKCYRVAFVVRFGGKCTTKRLPCAFLPLRCP